jgi:acyl-CoA hydrolase
MEVLVKVYAENMKSGSVIMTNKAYLTFVGLDDNGKPTAVPPLVPETDIEKQDFADAQKRREERLERKRKEIGW